MKNLDFSLEEVSPQLLLIADTCIYGVCGLQQELNMFALFCYILNSQYHCFFLSLEISFPFFCFLMLLLFRIQTFECKTSWLAYNKFRKCISLTQTDISVPIPYCSSCERYRQPAEHLGCDNSSRAMNSQTQFQK